MPDKRKPLDLSGANQILSSKRPALDLSGAQDILKKKVATKSVSQEELWGSDSQPQDLYTSLATGAQEPQQVSDGLDGAPKPTPKSTLFPETPMGRPTSSVMYEEKKPVLVESLPLELKPKKYYRIVSDEKKVVEKQLADLEERNTRLGRRPEDLTTEGTYQALQKQKAQLDEEFYPAQKAIREIQKEAALGNATLESIVSGVTQGKYSYLSTEVIKLNKEVEDKLIDRFDSAPEETKVKWYKGGLPLEAKEEIINSAKNEVITDKYDVLKQDADNYLKNIKDNPSIPLEEKLNFQKDFKKRSDDFNAQIAIDYSGKILKNNFKKTKESTDLDEAILSRYEGFIPDNLDILSTFAEGTAQVGAKVLTGIPSLALIGAERFNQLTGISRPEDYTAIEATEDWINDTTNTNFLPSSQTERGNIVVDGDLNPSYYSIGKTLAKTLPFTLKIMNDVKRGRIDGTAQSMISQLINPKYSKDFADKLRVVETAYKGTISDNYRDAKDMGMDDSKAFLYANTLSLAEGVSENIMPDYKYFDSLTGSSLKAAFKGGLKQAVTKQAAKNVTKDFFKNFVLETGEEEVILAVEDALKYSLLLNHKNSEFFNMGRQKELVATTALLSGALGTVSINKKFKQNKTDLYNEIHNNIYDLQDAFLQEIDSPLNDQKAKEAIITAYKFANDVSAAVSNAPENVTSDQIDLLVQKKNLEEKKKNIDTAFHPDINEEIAGIDAKIRELSKIPAVVEAPVVEEVVKPTEEQILKDKLEGNLVTFTYKDKSEVPDAFKDTIPSEVEVNGEKSIKVTVAKSLADYELSKATKPVVEAKVTPEVTTTTETEPITEEVATEAKAKEYSEELDKTKESDPEAYWSVSPVSAEDAAKGTIIDTPDGAAIVKPDGDIAGLFKKATSKAKGVAQDLLKRAVAAGGKKLDNFDTYLTPQYIKAGFRVVSRVPFSLEYGVPDGYNKEKHGTPDVVAMVYDPEGKLDIEEKTFDDYDEAMAYRDSFIEPSIEMELEGLAKLFDESDRGFKMSQVDKAKEALKSILPGVKFIVHETNEAYNKAVGDNSSGAYIYRAEGDKVIHINKQKANGRTVAHEVFHAVILDKIKGDKSVQEITARMMKAVYKTASPELKSRLDEFAARYSDESIRDEERLAELIGIIADGYPQMSQINKGIVKRWLDALAKMFGRKSFTDNEVIDLLNTLARKVSTGEVVSENDIKAITEDVSTYISEPTEIKRFQKTKEEKVQVGDHKLSFVKKSDLIDMDSLMKDISDKKEKVWFWVADQLGRGNYSDKTIGNEHYLDAGPSFALDPVNRDKNVIWASGASESELNKNINKSDYIFIISGSPQKSKLFNKQVFNLFEKRIGDYSSFKKQVLESGPTKPMRDVLNAHDSWNTLREDASVDNAKTKKIGTGRKKFLIALLDAMEKPKSKAYNIYQKRNAFVDINDLRDGFYKDNNFNQNDIMLVLKPTKLGDKSDHSTYETNILGDVIGVPDIKVNAFDIMPDEVKDKYKKDLKITEKQQAVAPYGIGVKTIERKQQANNIDDMVKIARQSNYSDAAITAFLKTKGFSDSEIANALKPAITEDEAYDKFKSEANKSREEITNKKTVKEYIKDKYKNIIKNWSNRQVEAQSLLSKTGMVNTLNLSINSHGYSGKAKRLFQKSYDKIYKGLSTKNREILDEVIQAKRFIAIDNNRAERGLDPVKHPNYINKNESQMYLDKLKKEIGDKAFNNISARADEYFSTYKKLLKDVYDNGLISKESYDSMSDVDYQPRVFLQFVTDFDGDLKTSKNSVDSTSLSSDQIKSMKEGDVNSLVTNSEWLLSNSLVARTNAMAKNNINKRFMTDEFPKAKERFDKLDPKNLKGDDVRFYKYFKELQSKVIDNPIIGYTDQGNPKYKYDDIKSPLNFTKTYYYINGVQNQFFLEDELHKSWMDNVDGFLSRDAKEILSYTSGSALVKAIATGNNPAFPIVNTPRDLMFTAAFSEEYSNLTPLALGQIAVDVAKSIKEIAKKDSAILNKYYEYGGAMDFLSSQGRLKKDSLIGSFIDKMIPANIRDITKGVFNTVTLKKVSEYSEVMFRLGIFQRSINNSLKELGFNSMSDVTDKQQVDDIYNAAVASARGILDFNKGGVAAKDLESIIPYVNVAFQGGSVALNAFKKNPVATTSRIFQIATIASTIPAGLSLFLIAASKDDDDDRTAHEIYLDAMSGVSKYQKSKYMNIVTGTKNEEGQYKVIKIAKAQELSPVISVTDDITENIIRGVTGKDPKPNETIVKNAMFSLKHNVLPFDITSPSGIIVRNPMIKSILTYQTGYDFFRDEPLAMNLEAKPAPYEGLDMKNVEGFYKDLGPKYGISPVRSKAFVESLITTPDTNPFIGILYGGAEAMSSNKDAKNVGENLVKNIYKSTGKRLISYTSDFNRNLEAKQKLEEKIGDIKLEDAILKSKIKIASDQYIAKDITKDQLMDEFKDLDPFDKKRALMKIRDKKVMKNIDSNIIDIKYEKSAKIKALMISSYYGDIFDKSEDSKDVIKQMARVDGILTPEVRYELKKIKDAQ